MTRYSHLLNNPDISQKDRDFFLTYIDDPGVDKKDAEKIIGQVRDSLGLAPALAALYMQQLASGFILASPDRHNIQERTVPDPETGLEFVVQWNPEREKRRDHLALVEMGIIKKDIDHAALVNEDHAGRGCYLCHENIALQNPLEILLPLELGGNRWYAGANFASLGESHFTIMPEIHTYQRYDTSLLAAMLEVIYDSGGYSRAVFNGLAGSSILCHQHFQIISKVLPVENIVLKDPDVVFFDKNSVVYLPSYYLPLVVFKSSEPAAAVELADCVISYWASSHGNSATENIIASWNGKEFTVLLFLRDMLLLLSPPKLGAIAGFEAAGFMAFSSREHEHELYKKASASVIRNIIRGVAPVTVPDQEELRAFLVKNRSGN